MARGIVLFLLCFLPLSAYADPVTVVVAVAGAAASAGGIGIALGVAGATFSWVAFGVSLALSALSLAFSPKPKKAGSSYGSIKSDGITQSFKQPVATREIVYGEVRKGGNIFYVTSTNSNKYLHMMIALASHEIESVDEVLIDDISITNDMLDFDGNIAFPTSRYDGYVRIRKHLGSASQTADTFAVSEIPEWTTDHRLRGIAYLYIRLQWNRNVFPNGIPNISAWVKGKKVYDSRTSTSYWTPNMALLTRDYLTDTSLGLGFDTSYIDDTIVTSSANICDEYVQTEELTHSILYTNATTDILTLDGESCKFATGDKVWLTSGTIGGLSSSTDYYVIPYQRQGEVRIKLATSLANALSGTAIDITSGSTGGLSKKAEPRYSGGGVLKMDVEPSNNLSELYLSMAGTICYIGGKWKIYAGSYRTPTISFSENDLAGGIQVTSKVSKSDRFNRIQGVYTGFINDGNPATYPIVKNDTYATQDGTTILKTRDLSFTQRPHTAQRIAKCELERMRQEISFTAKFKLMAFKVATGDNFYFNFARYGWSNKVFEVMNWKITVDGNAPVIEMNCRETASSCWDWNSGEETQVDPAPNTNLPSVYDVSPPSALVVTPLEIGTAENDKTYKFKFSWDLPSDDFVTDGGQYEIQFKKSTDGEWSPSFFVDGSQSFTDIYQVQPSINYDIQIRSINIKGVQSDFVSLYGFNVSSPSGTTLRLDYRYVLEGISESFDYGSVSGIVSEVLDYGTISGTPLPVFTILNYGRVNSTVTSVINYGAVSSSIDEYKDYGGVI